MATYDTSIVVGLEDRTSAGFIAMKRAGNETEKQIASLAQKVNELKDANAALRKSFDESAKAVEASKKKLDEAKKAYAENKDEISKTNLTKAKEEFSELTDTMKTWQRACSDSKKEIREIQQDIRFLENDSSVKNSSNTLSGWSAGFSAMGKQLSEAASGYASYYLSSSLGNTDATMASSILSGVLSGGSAGLLTGNPFGVAIGALAGGASGLISGLTAKAEQEDDVFKSYRDDLVSSVTAGVDSSLASGSATAAQREQDQIAFSALIGSDRSSLLLGRIKDLANLTPYLYDDLTGIAKQLSIYDSTSDQIYDRLSIIGDAGSALGMSSSAMEGLASLLGKVGDSEKYSSTYTRSLRNYGINPASILSEYYGITTAEANTLMASGDLSGYDAMTAIFSVLQSRYGGMMEKQAGTYAGALSTNQGLLAERDNYMGEAYNAVRITGLETQNAWLQQGDMQEAFGVIGAALAQKENYEASVEQAVMGGIFGDGTQDTSVLSDETAEKVGALRADYETSVAEYQDADEQRQMEIGAHIYSIYGDAQSLAASAADAAEAMDAWDEAALQLAEDTGQIVSMLGAHQDSLNLIVANTKGLASYNDRSSGWESAATAPTVGATYARYLAMGDAYRAENAAPKRAAGQHIIPHNDYLISAHEGEMLLTAAQAREYNSRSTGVLISGNEFIVRQESDIDAIAEALARKFVGTARIMAG